MTSTTLRLTGIPRTTTRRELSKAAGVSTDCISLAPTDSSHNSVSTATITFGSKRAADKFRSVQRFKPAKCLGKRPNIDTEFLGLTVLSTSGDQDEVDLIAVHGLNGHAFSSWASGDRMWLRDFLPAQMPKTRIMTYGYNSSVWDKTSTTTIPEFAQGLLWAIINKRGRKECNRPIIFVCHSLGGIIVKLALNTALEDTQTAMISTVTHGIVFLATPHKGSDLACNSFLGIAAKALGVREDLILALCMNSGQLDDIENDFRLNHDGLDLATFYETKKTKIARVVSAFDHVIVERSSALLNVGADPRYPLERDHKQICKFACQHDDDYKAVCNQILRMAEVAPHAVRTRAIKKALQMPQISTMIKFGGDTLRSYSSAWSDDCTLKLR
ncbi:hypothetical protein BZA05DRAFT_172765 [Tricharina praecox]|uniref:uncharacterized protein n=1 Tax=Tricharina praecox TaxID=43433 RepID=UPI00222007A6|nr:uncharacterized protein BZA05DRAFT_172765 [Tricharina praecox]KAI5844262.1 hypothetical protein BZA05DRAFT_172765 [Tricharina praecox]